MRCPKCSYISFDVVESCTKCGKNISKAAEELKGTIAETPPPVFLKFGFEESGQDSFAEEAMADQEETVMDLGLEEDEGMVGFSGEEDATAAEAVDFEIEEEAAAEEPAADFEISEEVEEPEKEALGISDLAPEEPQEEAVELAEEPLQGLEEEVAAESFEEELPTESEVEREAKELEDLEVEGIDLEGSSAPKSGKVMPSVKTGTALDDFDIDLGELISPKDDKKS